MVNANEEEVRVLILNENEHKNEELYRLKKGWILQIVLSARLSWRKVRLWTNIPLNETDPFARSKYNELNWICPSSQKYDDSNRYALISCCKAGVFHYYFTIDGTTEREACSGEGYFQIEPELIWPDGSGDILEQDCITCQTVLSKSLGPIEEWLNRLEVARHTGYNIIHFTPIQKLYHVSNSSYAITDHHQLNEIFHGTFDRIKSIVDQMAKEWRIFSITDLVYNHVANDCALLRNHPEAAYNLINSPHLRPAVLLDSILMQFTRDASEGKLSSRGIPAQIKEYHLQIIRQYFFDEIFPQYHFSEYYICDIQSLIEQFAQQLSQLDHCPRKPSIENDSDFQLVHGKYQRMKTTVNLQLAEKLYFYQRKDFSTIEEWRTGACDALKTRLEHLNHLVTEKLNDNLNHAIDNCLSSCRYHFFAYDGPKFDRISYPNTPFVGNYFAYPNGELKPPMKSNN